uniref:Uncharacterized protein n=1 Tax=Anguilla anguilla TaxID=7936 RepID=A0A0E9TA68_ANGAN
MSPQRRLRWSSTKEFLSKTSGQSSYFVRLVSWNLADSNNVLAQITSQVSG